MSKTQTNETRERQHEHHASGYASYRAESHAEINKARRLVRHLRGHGDDPCAIAALQALPMEVLRQVPQALEFLRSAGSA